MKSLALLISGLLISLFWLGSCAYKESKIVQGILRDYRTGAIVRNATILSSQDPGLVIRPDTLGYFEFPKRISTIKTGDSLLIRTETSTIKIPISPHMRFLKIFLKRDSLPLSEQADKVADMHYHITMKPHNEYGLTMYRNRTKKHPVVEKRIFGFKKNISLNVYNNSEDNDQYALWSVRYREIKVLHEGKYVKPGKIRPIADTHINFDSARKLATLYEGKWIRPKKPNNNLYHYTQATLPHLRDGNVKLAFNAISPFEYNLANTLAKRLISKTFKSNAERWWLKYIGGYYEKDKYFYLTHWQNFLNEKALLKNQSASYNNLGWKFLQQADDLRSAQNNTNYIINVLEGSHALQGENLMRYLYKTKEEIAKDEVIISTAKELAQKPENLNKIPYDTLATRLYNQSQQSLKSLPKKEYSAVVQVAKKDLRTLAMDELKANIEKVKADATFPIFMVTISHLSWNGMTGHAPGLDTQGFGRILIKRFYRIKASNNKNFLGQWKSLFYSEPINEFGKTLINDLLDKRIGGRRMLIDLKHADFFTRSYFYDSVMTKHKDVPPICSHCAVNGLKEIYHSPFVDEYSLLKSSADSVFYPFGLNLYDEEITRICRRGGIIGLPLEQRVLGGYMKPVRKKIIRKSVDMMMDLDSLKSLFQAIRTYNQSIMGIPDQDATSPFRGASFDRFIEDYYSVDPFLQNLFYILDHSEKKGKAAWQHVCLGSDLDGIIDPIDVCPTASQYPHFRQRMIQFIPLFLWIRQMQDPQSKGYSYYFNDRPNHPADAISLKQAMDAVMYGSLKEFVACYFDS